SYAPSDTSVRDITIDLQQVYEVYSDTSNKFNDQVVKRTVLQKSLIALLIIVIVAGVIVAVVVPVVLILASGTTSKCKIFVKQP
ncbi:unnamed protein product, partial [Rotaria sp. Silwood2]